MEVGEVVRLIIIVDLVEHLGAGRPAWGPVHVEDVCVRCPHNRPGGPSSGGGSGSGFLVTQLDTELAA
jgi:hypothetical protein